MKRSTLIAMLITMMICSLALVGNFHLDTVKGDTPVTGIISSDTTWTQASSPYNLSGNVLVDEGVILTIEPGVTVYFNGYFMNVGGTLSARGTETDEIFMSGSGISDSGEWKGRIVFLATSTNSIIEYAQITSTAGIIIGIYTSSVTINFTAISGSNSDAIFIYGNSSPLITENHISNSGTCINIFGGSSAIISNNSLTNSGSGIKITEGNSPTITGNIISNNSKGIYVFWHVNSLLISDNIISNNALGIDLDFEVSYNNVSTVFTITRNLIINNYDGQLDGGAIRIGPHHPGNISSNTIVMNTNGLLVYGIQNLTATQNNIYGNANYNVRLDTTSDINASYNWWGTTNTTVISQSIYDFYDDFNLGTVTFIPHLTEPNSAAPAIPDTYSILIMPLFMIATLVGVLFYKKKHTLKCLK